jgi:glycosyltransferase involved in cell wall biosynthesis
MQQMQQDKMMVELISPENFQWLDGYYAELNKYYGVRLVRKATGQPAACRVFLWANEDTANYINGNEKNGEKWIVYIRRYEFFGPARAIKWGKVDEVVFVNDVLQSLFEAATNIKSNLIYNGVTLDNWTYKDRKHGKKIASVGWINYKKNLPLTMQILASLPKDYELHLLGGVQQEDIILYVDYISRVLERGVIITNRIPREQVDAWLDDKDYILCSSLTEGNPNFVIEGMAKGIKPVVHNYPGAMDQFGNMLVFNTVEEAKQMILPDSPYESKDYREIVSVKFGEMSYIKLRRLVDKQIGV